MRFARYNKPPLCMATRPLACPLTLPLYLPPAPSALPAFDTQLTAAHAHVAGS